MSMNCKRLILSTLGRQRGLTLIEIMVALLIGVFLLAGVIQIFIVNKQTYRVQENLSRMQENGRFAIDYLNHYIRLAGYITTKSLNDIRYKDLSRNSRTGQNDGSSITSSLFNSGNKVISGTNGDGLNSSDSITVRFQADPPADGQMADCLGNTVSSPNGDVIVANRFFLQADASNNNQPTLYCDPLQATDPTAQPVISGVENMQIRYCVPADSTDTNIGCVLAGNDVSDWNQIQSVRVSLLLRSADDNLVVQPQPYQFDVNGDGVNETITPSDKRLRRVFTTTIAVRNLVK
ncbi:MAG: PilW family protein [Candidatus Contendobacter sp.]|nr:PilW family protein [Candidatus Contendobacter sp.]